MLSFKIFYFVLFLSSFLFLPVHSSFAQQDTLALVNGEPITSDEFITRFELTIYPGKKSSNLAETKKEFLYSLVAEKLLSNQSQISSPEDPDEKYLKDEIESVFLRDALFRKEILSKIKISDDDLNRGIRYSKYNYIVDAFYFPDSIWADNFRKKIDKRSGQYVYHLSDSLNLCHDTLEIGYGESDETIENAFFTHDINYNSHAVNTIDGWVVFRVIDKQPDARFSSVSAEENAEMVRKIISYRKGYRAGRDYILAVMKGIEVNVNYRIFNPLVYKIKSVLSTHQPSSFEGGYYLSRRELSDLKTNFSFDPRAPMLRFDGGELTLGYIFDNLSLAGFAPVDTSIREITFSLHNAMKLIVQNYFLARRAKEMGLENSSEVQYNTRAFLDAYRSFQYENAVTDTVGITETELNKFYESHQDEVLRDIRLRLQIFQLDNIDEAAKILNRLSRENQSPDTTGAVWLYASQLGEMGAVLSDLDNGSSYGPLLMNGKYTIFRLLEKKSNLSRNDIDKSMQAARDLMLEQKQKETLNTYISKLSTEQRTKIFESKLDKIEVTPIQMLTFRYIGFGGKIIAAPALYPREGWIKYLDDKKDILP